MVGTGGPQKPRRLDKFRIEYILDFNKGSFFVWSSFIGCTRWRAYLLLPWRLTPFPSQSLSHISWQHYLGIFGSGVECKAMFWSRLEARYDCHSNPDFYSLLLTTGWAIQPGLFNKSFEQQLGTGHQIEPFLSNASDIRDNPWRRSCRPA